MPMLSSEELQSFNELFTRCEKALKISEDWTDNIPVAPINQLRYATRHLLDASQASSPCKKSKELAEARTHCDRAWFDAMDAILAYGPSYFHAFEKRFEAVDISSVVSNYIEKRSLFIDGPCKVEEVRMRIEQQGDGSFDRESFYGDECLNDLAKKYADAQRLLRHAEPELNKQLRAHREALERYLEQLVHNKSSATFSKWGAVWTFCAMILTGVGVYLTMSVSSTPGASASPSQQAVVPSGASVPGSTATGK